MKYGVLYFKYSEFMPYLRDRKPYYNIGDNIQSCAVEQLYQSMGIPPEQILYISDDELETYCGEYVIICLNIYGGLKPSLKFSDHIIPVFMGYNCPYYLDDDTRKVLMKHQPIGCRDEITLRNLRERNIEAYLTGCVTVTLPKRETPDHEGKVFLVDVPKTLWNHIPEELKRNSVTDSHIRYDIVPPFSNSDALKVYETAKHQLELYKNEAKLIVTSRLHCASPCLAMGIPTILVKQNADINLSWIDRFLPIYTEDNFSNIDWNPKLPEMEPLKQQIKELFITRIRETFDQKAALCKISYAFESRSKTQYVHGLYRKLNQVVSTLSPDFRFALWGLGSGGAFAYRMIMETCPHAQLELPIDCYKTGEFHGKQIVLPNKLTEVNVDYIFITTYSGRKDAVDYMNVLNRKREVNWCFMINKDNGEDEYYW